MKKIQLTLGKFALVDDEDYEILNKYKWHCHSSSPIYGYAVRSIYPKGIKKTILMHRIILNAKYGQNVDHENRNPLDNRRKNLRIATKSENSINSKIYKNNTSGFRGVGWHKGIKMWYASLCINQKDVHIGYYENKIDAAKAYDKKAKELFGKFAKLNF